MPYKKEYHKLTCPKCNKEYEVLTPAYLRKIKDTKYGMLCTSCRAKVQWEELSEEDKIKKNTILTKARVIAYNHKSDDDKKLNIEKRKEGIKKYWSSLSDEDKKNISEKRSADRKEYLSNLTEEEINTIGKKISITKKTTNLSMSEEDKLKRKKSKQEERKRYWDNLSEEERAEITQLLRDNNQKFIVNMSDEERQKRSEIMTNRNNEFWTNAPEYIIQNRLTKLNENGKIYRENLTDEDKLRISNEKKEYWANLPEARKSELVHKRLSNNIAINKFHQRFEDTFNSSILYEKFYINPEVGTSNNSIIHSWDYGIYNRESNELIALVDLDGAYFHADNSDYDGIHSKEEYDEVRSQSVPNEIKSFIIQELNFSNSFKYLLKNIMIDYKEYTNRIFMYCRSMPFPNPSYSDKELIKSYNSLLNMKTNDKYHQDISLNTRLGDRLIQHFHPSIWQAHRSGCISPFDAWYDDKLLMQCIENRTIYQNHLNRNKILQGFNVSKIAPKVSVFSAGRAKILIDRYLSEYKTIYDPFSGFSGRMLGAISLGKSYIGSDISDIHVTESNNMINFLREYYNNIQAEVFVHDILDKHIQGSMDCLFTCPPYGLKEQWLDVQLSDKTCDEWIDICIDKFKCKRYLFIVDYTEKYKEYIVDIIGNKSHLGSNGELVLLIE